MKLGLLGALALLVCVSVCTSAAYLEVNTNQF